MNRGDFLWKHKMWMKQKEEGKIIGYNKIILSNILPDFLAETFLNSNSVSKGNLFYSEEHPNAVVMFASIPNYKDFYEEHRSQKCMRVLNTIITKFDGTVYSNRFSNIEKIKTIGSTYMVASGLDHILLMDQFILANENKDKNLVEIVKLSFALMEIIHEINRTHLQGFRLRIGVNQGPVVAGVLGSQKPCYDIWGDTVNVASRMESCGLPGRIQLP